MDEAGRGPWAGPVVAGACALKKGKKYAFSSLLNDSKKLSPKKREEIFVMIQKYIQTQESVLHLSMIHNLFDRSIVAYGTETN